jgi:hypothetical protein
MAADWPRIMKTGSIRIDPNAMCDEETPLPHTSRFVHSSAAREQ